MNLKLWQLIRLTVLIGVLNFITVSCYQPNSSTQGDLSDNNSSEASMPTDNNSPEASMPTDNNSSEASMPTDNNSPEASTPTDNNSSEASMPTDNNSSEASMPTDNNSPESSTPTDNNSPESSTPTDNNTSRGNSQGNSYTAQEAQEILYRNLQALQLAEDAITRCYSHKELDECAKLNRIQETVLEWCGSGDEFACTMYDNIGAGILREQGDRL